MGSAKPCARLYRFSGLLARITGCGLMLWSSQQKRDDESTTDYTIRSGSFVFRLTGSGISNPTVNQSATQSTETEKKMQLV